MIKKNRLVINKAIVFVCDIQEKFAPLSYKPEAVI